MPTLADEPLRKTTLNLYAEDVEQMERRYGRGWSEIVRNLVRQHVQRKIIMQYGGEADGQD